MRAILLALALVGASAQARDLPVPAGKGWQHAATGLILRPTLTGLPRTALTDSTAGEWDVVAQFNDPNIAESTTLYLFHAATPDVGIWFDRADWQVQHRKSFDGSTPLGQPVAFAPPSSAVLAGLRRSYRPNKGPYRSTTLAVLPLGAWLIAIRMSSTTLDQAGLDARLTAAIAEIGWPKGTAAPAAAVPVASCPTSLAYQKAKLRKPDMSQMLLGSMLAGIVASRPAALTDPAPKPWCRDGEGTETYGVYRAGAEADGYMLALGDAGRTASIYKGVSLPGTEPGGGYAVTARNVDGTAATYPSFDALPRPDQVVKLLTTTAPLSHTSASSRDVSISINSLAK